MSGREIVVLGTASQAPTRRRNHNALLVRLGAEVVLFDPGEGTQRQLVFAGESAASITRIAITHFHGDHCLGLPGVLARRCLDGVGEDRPVEVYHPARDTEQLDLLRRVTLAERRAAVVPVRVAGAEHRDTRRGLTVVARPLDHRVTTYGYRLQEPDGRRLLPDALAAAGISGPAVGELVRAGHLRVGERTVDLRQVSVPRPGQAVAVVMDTRWCPTAVELAAGADVLVAESTFLESEAHLAERYGHLTAGQAGRLAAEAGVRRLVLTHFSQRHPQLEPFAEEAARRFGGEVVAAADLERVPVPPRA